MLLAEQPDLRRFLPDMRALARKDFLFFAVRAFEELHGGGYQHNWHIGVIAQQLVEATLGDTKRLMITMPPRSMKSFLASVCLPAWLLGRDPQEKIICASYAQKLAEEFAFECRKLMQTDWYRSVFPHTHIDPKKCNQEVIATTRGGRRRATSVGGTLTGLGGNLLIIDDPIKAADGSSEVARDRAIKWYGGTAASRLDDPKRGRIIVIAQRLHQEDLCGYLRQSGTSWSLLELPLIEWQNRTIDVAGITLERPAGHLLHEDRIGEEEIARLRAEMGKRDFEAQYNQRPLPPGGALFKMEWLQRYDETPPPHQIQDIFQSWDTAYDIEEQHDYSVCTTWALSGKRYYLLDVFRKKLEFYALEQAVYDQRKKWRAALVIVEKAGSGISLWQNVRNKGGKLWLQTLRPEGSKQDRASKQSPKFQRGEVWLPRKAPWLSAFEDELGAFPHGKHDDQIDSVVQFLAAVDTGELLIKADQARRLR
ncbi:phage terminase large subunit [Altererythrobacter sp. SALINAS58]|uniref:phage terminase large subunit n=1 Tax=Alteripontixanthobacter muriae TaxID=2705546 RepID=UPI001576622A|nr:phage terminase large subunit [Alteripontixanthobacter muriae]NTZ42153.1 phage terminase large subunit [Alteripontixanthobacter muriae]